MKISGARLQAFLRVPDPAVGAALLYGPDRGLVCDRSNRLAAASGATPGDPFATVDLSAATLRSDPPRLCDAARTVPLGGGRACVRVRDAVEHTAAAARLLIECGTWPSFVTLEAGELGKRSSLRELFEKATNAVAIPCYEATDSSRRDAIAASLQRLGLSADRTALDLLTATVGRDRDQMESDLEKLSLYKGGQGAVTREEIATVISGPEIGSLSTAVACAALGDLPGVERNLTVLHSQSIDGVAVVRAAITQFARLLEVRRKAETGVPVSEAINALRPPIFFSAVDAFRAQLRIWTTDRLVHVIPQLLLLEAQCKVTGARQDLLAATALFDLARAVRDQERLPTIRC